MVLKGNFMCFMRRPLNWQDLSKCLLWTQYVTLHMHLLLCRDPRISGTLIWIQRSQTRHLLESHTRYLRSQRHNTKRSINLSITICWSKFEAPELDHSISISPNVLRRVPRFLLNSVLSLELFSLSVLSTLSNPLLSILYLSLAYCISLIKYLFITKLVADGRIVKTTQ